MTPIILHDVGMRDGLQVEQAVVPTSQKIAWIEHLARSGVDMIQVGSFVHKEKVPQMADTDELFRHFASQGRTEVLPHRDHAVSPPAQGAVTPMAQGAAPSAAGDAGSPPGRDGGTPVAQGSSTPAEPGAGAAQMAQGGVTPVAQGFSPAFPVLTGLVLNERGQERALDCGVRYLCMGVSASDTHSRKNTGMSTVEAIDRVLAMARSAAAASATVQVSVQSAFGCGYEGLVPEERVLGIVRRFVDAGFRTISLADTAGHANPAQVEQMFTSVMAIDPAIECACHLHDTYGFGLANAYAALRVGVKYFESAFAGLGGCPFTAITGGNVCTEDLVQMLQRMGQRQDVRLDVLIDLAKDAGRFFARDMPGRAWKTGTIPWGQV